MINKLLKKYKDYKIFRKLNSTDFFDKMYFIHITKLESCHILKAQNDRNKDIRIASLYNPNASIIHVIKALNDKDSHVRNIGRIKLQKLLIKNIEK